MENELPILKKKLIFLAGSLSILGHSIDIATLYHNKYELWLNLLTIIITAFVLLFSYLKKIKVNFSNAVIIYSIFINMILSIPLKENIENMDAIILQTSIIYGILILYTGFVLKKAHIFIIGIIYSLFYVIMAIHLKGFVLDHIFLIMVLIIAYIVGVLSIVNIVSGYQYKLVNLVEQLTERNEQLKKQGTELNKLNKTKDKILSIIGHDLKTPASSVMGFSELISLQSDKFKSESLKQYSKLIYQSANRLSFCLSQILDWGRLQTGNKNLNIQKLNINEAINDVVDLMHGTIYLKNISVEKNTSDEIYINADKQMLSTIIRNLFTNALKYSFANSSIKISSELKESNYQFSVTDSGVGIEPKITDRIFTKEHIESKPGTENEKGTGLGMAIVKEYIQLHKGEIWVESKLGKGSTFYFTIPVNK